MTLSEGQDDFLKNDGFDYNSTSNDKKEPSAEEELGLYLLGLMLYIALILANIFVPLPAYSVNTPPQFATLSQTQPFRSGFLKRRSSSALQESRSSSSALSPPQTRPRSIPRSSSRSEYSLPSLNFSSFLGTSVRLQRQTVKKTKAIRRLNIRQSFNSKKENKRESENQLTWQAEPILVGQTALKILEKIIKKDNSLFKNFMDHNELTDKNLIALVRETSAQLTNCTLNTREELEIIYPVIAKTFDYFDINPSLFSKEKEYDLLDQEIACTRFLLSSEFKKSDSFFNSTCHAAGFYRPFSSIMPAQTNWSLEWIHEWQKTFKNIKIATADELGHVKDIGLGRKFEQNKSHVYCHVAKICSISHLYFFEKTVKAFQLFCDARCDDLNCPIALKDVLPKVNALYKNESLRSYFDREYKTYSNTILLHLSEDQFSDSLERLCNENIGYRRPICSLKKGQRYSYPELNSLRAKNFQLFELSIIPRAEEPKDEMYLNS